MDGQSNDSSLLGPVISQDYLGVTVQGQPSELTEMWKFKSGFYDSVILRYAPLPS